MKLTFVQWHAGLEAASERWSIIAGQLSAETPDVLVTNEMPFGPWLASKSVFDKVQASHSVAQHEAGVEALHVLGLPLVLSSRPVKAADQLANEAFALSDGQYRFLHQKHFFPQEEGWNEQSWFGTAVPGFELAELQGVKVGVLLCAELMFNDKARDYGLAGADLIVVPRATGLSLTVWQAGCAMAAIVSGIYVVSSNRVGPEPSGPIFGGGGLAYAPDGSLLAQTSATEPIVSLTIDLAWSRRKKYEYPCYVFPPKMP